MSAYICSPIHIATCAQLIKDAGKYDREIESMTVADIAIELAKANMASVAWRYGPEGQAAYAGLLNFIGSHLSDAGYTPDQVIANVGTTDLEDMLGDQTVNEYLAACRWARPHPSTPAEAWQYLRCYRYQSCEPPQWDASKVNGWVTLALEDQGEKMSEIDLNGRFVWDVPEAA